MLGHQIASGGGSNLRRSAQILALAHMKVRVYISLALLLWLILFPFAATSAIGSGFPFVFLGGDADVARGADDRTNTIMQTSLQNELKGDVTSIMVAHRLQTIIDADKVVSRPSFSHDVNANSRCLKKKGRI